MRFPYFNKALKLRPDLPDANNNLGNILLEAGHVDDAIDCYQKALKIQPAYVARA